jgi:hypothetical protein
MLFFLEIRNIKRNMNMLKIIKKISALSVFALMSACGGGGGGSGGAAGVVNISAEGIWGGTASTGFDVSLVVLENGETWGIYSSGSTIYGAIYGTTATSSNIATFSGTEFDFSTNSSSSGTLTGAVAAKSTLALSGSGLTASLTYDATYDATPTQASGTWSFVGRSSAYELIPDTIVIDNTGSFTLNQSNCTTNGSIVPRAGGKNIYDITLNSSGSGCAVGQSTMTGVTYLETSVTPNKFLSLALTSDKSDGLIIIGTKQ